jgi:hypothetical protein
VVRTTGVVATEHRTPAERRIKRNAHRIPRRGDAAIPNIPRESCVARAAILAPNGYEEGTRNDARTLGVKPLLPEERALIAPLLP